jgi:hypothetical protein
MNMRSYILEQWVWNFSSQAQEEKNGRCQNFRVVYLCRILLEVNIAVAIQMYISICALLRREISDHHFENVVR